MADVGCGVTATVVTSQSKPLSLVLKVHSSAAVGVHSSAPISAPKVPNNTSYQVSGNKSPSGVSGFKSASGLNTNPSLSLL